jgi:hypothetical protein
MQCAVIVGRQFRGQVLRGFDDALVRFAPDAARALDQVCELAALLTQGLLSSSRCQFFGIDCTAWPDALRDFGEKFF